MLKCLILLILTYVIYLQILGNNYYLITIFLIKVCPIICLLLLLSGNLFFLIYLLFYSVYRIIIYDYNKGKIPTHMNTQYIQQVNKNSTRFINYHLLNYPNINSQRNYIYLYSPHALYAHGFLHLFGSFNGILEQPIIGLVHKLFLLTPFLGDLFENCGFMECNYKNLNNLLSLKKNIGFIPGGLDEAILTQKNTETIYINKRKGIFELAIKHGTPIIPIMATGESDFYSYPLWTHKIPSSLIRLFLYTFSWGNLYFPWKCQKNNIHIMFGEPIYPSSKYLHNENIEILKNSYIESLRDLHQQINQKTNQKRELIIL